MIFDYVMNPIICVIWCSKAALNFLPEVPGPIWIVFFAALFTGLNLRGIRASARTNQWLAAGLGVVIVLFFGAALRYLLLHPPGGWGGFTRPFYDPATFSFGALSAGASLAVLTYIGFDGISTLSEEVHNPRRNVLLATVLVCLVTGVLAALQVYVAQLVWPEPASTFPDKDTAFVHVAGRAGGAWLFHVVNIALLVASIGSGMGAHLGAGRLLYGMGRDNAIPRRFFGVLHPRTRIPANNILLVGVGALVGAFAMDYGLGAELLNFGALVGFMGVNLSSLVHYYVRGDRKRWHHLWPPILGFAVCAYLWTSLSWKALIIGFCWLGLGVLYGAWRTGGYRRPIEMFTGDDSPAAGERGSRGP
jgi:amino acid transporter